jgi:glycosyltransferase involved in cell wall biosynthesis
VLGCFRSESGLGQAARASLAALRHLDRDFSYVDTSEMYPSRNAVDPGLSDRPFGAFGDVNLLHSNADELLTLGHQVFRHRLAGRFNAAMWFWETADLPKRSRPAFDCVDELWVASEYLADVFGQYAKVPVKVIGLAAELPEPREVARSEFGLRDDEFVFLFVYDALSAHGRKNPEKALEAYVKAFDSIGYSGVRFVLKVSNLNKFPASQARIRDLASRTDSITVIDEYFPRDRVMDLMSVADVYVSLHAAEGFGLTLLEAMAVGAPVICTGYSGNMDFSSPENSWLVDFTMMKTDEPTGPYPAGSIWASPNLDSVIDLMRHVREHPDEVERKRVNARRDALETASLERYAARLDEHLRRVL